MPIAETAAVATIISKLLSMSTDLLERKESREIATEIKDIQKLTIKLHSLYTEIETKHHEIESSLQEKLFNSQSQITKLERDNFTMEREKDEILKRFDEWDQYERKVSQDKFVLFANKNQPGVYACAVCKGKEPSPRLLQPWDTSIGDLYYICNICKTAGNVR